MNRVRRIAVHVVGVVAGAAPLVAVVWWLDATRERTRLGAMVLQGEPALHVLVAWGAYALFLLRRPALATGLLVGAAFVALALRAPLVAELPGPPPPGSQTLHDCARRLPAFAAPDAAPARVRVLQWTLDGAVDPAALIALSGAAQADLTIVHGPVGEGLGQAYIDALGGDALVHPSRDGGADGRLVHTRGVFHACGSASQGSEAVDGPYGTTVLFVGVPPDLSFPLLVGRLPAPEDARADWPRSMRDARERLASLAELLAVPSTLAVADAHATWGYRGLDSALLGAGLVPVAVAPSGPRRVLGVPFPPLHPWDRVWTGPAWRAVASRRLPTSDATLRAPILTTLEVRGSE